MKKSLGLGGTGRRYGAALLIAFGSMPAQPVRLLANDFVAVG